MGLDPEIALRGVIRRLEAKQEIALEMGDYAEVKFILRMLWKYRRALWIYEHEGYLDN